MPSLFSDIEAHRKREKLLATLLWVANGSVRESIHEPFYAMKAKILRKHGFADGFDLQCIKHECWGCNGTGGYHDWDCYRCNGTGTYSRTYWWLARYRFGGRVFHVPVERAMKPEGLIPTIHGKIKHRQRKWSAECALALAFVLGLRDSYQLLHYRVFQEVSWKHVRRIIAVSGMSLDDWSHFGKEEVPF